MLGTGSCMWDRPLSLPVVRQASIHAEKMPVHCEKTAVDGEKITPNAETGWPLSMVLIFSVQISQPLWISGLIMAPCFGSPMTFVTLLHIPRASPSPQPPLIFPISLAIGSDSSIVSVPSLWSFHYLLYFAKYMHQLAHNSCLPWSPAKKIKNETPGPA